MIKKGLFLLFVFGLQPGWAQFGVAFHQSNLPFVGFNYEFKDRFRPEARLGTDQFISEFSFELAALLDLVQTTDVEFYTGLGIRLGPLSGVVLPVGLQLYPLPNKNFGFHIEMAGIAGEDSWLRGSWGLRYRFRKPPAE